MVYKLNLAHLCVQCTWAINTVIDHYNRLGRPIFACSMDLSKAFDMASWAKLFPELLKRKYPLDIKMLNTFLLKSNV